jgi:hypothetical protein
MALPPVYVPSGNLFGTSAATTPYTYGNLGSDTSAYNIWGSKGNPYLVAGPSYTPGSGAPIVPQPIAPTPPSGGGSDYPVAPGTGGDIGFDDQPWANRKVLSDLYPGLGLAYGLVDGRIDNPYGEGYARLPWYEGSAGGGYGYTEPGYDKYAPGDTDRGIYDASTGERAWDDSFDDYNTNDRWADTGFWDGMVNVIGGRTWDGLEEPAIFGDPNSNLAKEATRLQITEKAEKAANRKAIADAEQAKVDAANAAEQAKADAQQAQWDSQYAQINDLNTNQISLMNDIKTDMTNQYGTFQDEILSQVAAENASMFDTFADYKEWMGEQFTTQQSGLDEALAIAAAKSEGLNGTQIDLMNSIAEDMRNDYGDFSGGVGGQLEQMAAENASMFDSLEEYQAWNDEQNVAAPVSPVSPPPAPPSSGGDDGYGDSSGGGGGWEGSDAHSDMDADSGWSGADSDFDDVSDSGGGGGDSGGGGGGSYIATAATQSLGTEGLTVFNNWRDHMHSWHPTFTTSLGF